MFVSGGLSILLALLFLLLLVVLLATRKLSWFGRLPGDVRYEGRRTRVYAPLTSMLLLSIAFSLLLLVLSAIF